MSSLISTLPLAPTCCSMRAVTDCTEANHSLKFTCRHKISITKRHPSTRHVLPRGACGTGHVTRAFTNYALHVIYVTPFIGTLKLRRCCKCVCYSCIV